MFNHSDTLETSSWHGTVLGTKWWYVCKGECFESYVEPGEVLYYGAGWSHETQNLVTPTLTVTGTVVHEWNYRTVANRLHSECSASALNFLFSAELCDALDKCYDHWHEHVRLRRLASFSLCLHNRRQPRHDGSCLAGQSLAGICGRAQCGIGVRSMRKRRGQTGCGTRGGPSVHSHRRHTNSFVLSVGNVWAQLCWCFRAASPKIIQDKEAIRPEHNNYDGRNYITE